MNVIDIVIYTVLVFIIAYFGYRNIALRRKLQDTVSRLIQSQIDASVLISEYSNVVQELENKKIEKSDDFLKFLSDSRDAAFDYIENVQSVLTKFDKQMNKIFKWNETYGSTGGSNPHSDKIKEISMAYKQLKDLLPENNQTPNN